MRSGHPSVSHRGLTLTDVCLTLALLVLLAGGLLPHVRRLGQEQRNRMKCASNLRQIAMAATIYANANRFFPRLYWDPKNPTPALYTGASSPRSFSPGAPTPPMPVANDVSGAFYLLFKNEQLPSNMFTCPSDEATPVYPGKDNELFANFPGRANLSYSYNNPYPTQAAVNDGWTFKPESGTEAPLAADMNYGDGGGGSPTKVAFDALPSTMRIANSANHDFEGQNVAFCDGHVEWEQTPFCGFKKPGNAWRDNVYANDDGVDAATGKGGKTHGPPMNRYDAVLLPTYFDGPQPAGARSPMGGGAGSDVAAAAAAAAGGASGTPWALVAAVAAAVLAAAGVAAWLVLRRRGQPQMVEAPPISGRRPPG